MKLLPVLIFCFIIHIGFGQTSIENKMIDNSRNSCIKIISKQGNSSGTGFFISNDIIVTCFHVIAQISNDGSGNVNFNIFQDLKAVNEIGDTVNLTCISIPNNLSPEPFLQDFALLRLAKPISQKSILKISEEMNQNIGDNIMLLDIH
jgi:hypothetical protein